MLAAPHDCASARHRLVQAQPAAAGQPGRRIFGNFALELTACESHNVHVLLRVSGARWCRYNLLREDSEGWAKVLDVLGHPLPADLSPAALGQTVRPPVCTPGSHAVKLSPTGLRVSPGAGVYQGAGCAESPSAG